jgi:hypothetical protein
MASKTTYRDMALFPLQHIKYPYHVSTVFPSPSLDLNRRINSIRRSSASPARKPGDGLNSEVQMLDTLHIVDYRYSRFALDPRTGLFNIIRYPSPCSPTRICMTHDHTETGEIRPGRIFYPYKMVSTNQSDASGLYYLETMRLTSKANPQFHC